MDAAFDELLTDLASRGELVTGEALADPTSAAIYRWRDSEAVTTDGPYAQSEEHLAGFFVIDVEGRARAEAIAIQFATPGDTIELRPAI